MEEKKESEIKGKIATTFISMVGAIFIGVASSYIATERNVALIQRDAEYLARDMRELKKMVGVVSAVQIELASRGSWMVSVDMQLSSQSNAIKALTGATTDRLTATQFNLYVQRNEAELQRIKDKLDKGN